MHNQGRRSRQGSSMIFVIGVISVITLCFLGALYTAIRALELTTMRETYTQKKWATEGILTYAISYATTHYDILYDYLWTRNERITLWFDQLQIGSGTGYWGCVILCSARQGIRISATIYKETEVMGSIYCQLNARECQTGKEGNQGKRMFSISGWQSE